MVVRNETLRAAAENSSRRNAIKHSNEHKQRRRQVGRVSVTLHKRQRIGLAQSAQAKQRCCVPKEKEALGKQMRCIAPGAVLHWQGATRNKLQIAINFASSFLELKLCITATEF